MGLEALGAIAGGINRGMDWTQRDREIEEQRQARNEDREYQRGLRNFQQGQQQRTLDEQGRQDKLAEAMSGIKPAGTEIEVSPGQVDMTTGQMVPPVKKTQTDIAVARQEGQAYKDARLYDKAKERWMWADEAASRNAANRFLSALSSVRTSGQNMPLIDMAKTLAVPVDEDESPIGVDRDSIKEGPNGSVSLRVFNKNTGYSENLVLNNKADLQRALMYHVAPDYARKLDETERAKQAKIEEERAKPVNTTAGGVSTLLNPDGSILRQIRNDNGLVNIGTEENQVMVPYGKAAAAGAAGAGKTSKKTDSPNSPYMSAFQDMIKMSDAKFSSPDEATKAMTIADTFAAGAGYDTTKLPPNVAMQVAINYLRAGGSKAEAIGIDPATGAVRREYKDPEYGSFSLGQFNGKLTPEQSRDLSQKLLSSQGYGRDGKPMSKLVANADGTVASVEQTSEDIAKYQKQLRAAAFDTSGPNGTSVARRQLEEDIRSQVDLAAREAIAKNPNAADQVKRAAEARVSQELQILGRKLNIIKSGMTAEKSDGDSARQVTRSDIISRAGGLNPKLSQVATERAKAADEATASERAQRQAELEAGRAKAETNKKLRADAAAITRDVINDPRLTLEDLMDIKAKYDMVMDGRQREALYSRIDQLRRKMPPPTRQ